MRDSVLDGFWKLANKFEGATDYMYADIYNLVTTGLGNMFDSSKRNTYDASSSYMYPEAYNYGWRHRGTDLPASQDEIAQAFTITKSHPELNKQGGGHYKGLTDLYLSQDDVKKLVMSKLQAMENELRGRFPAYDSWPADAQLGLLSMAWALGPAFKFPAFSSAANALVPDFRTAAKQSHISNANPDRNAANYQMFMNAADVLDQSADPDALYWPNSFLEGAATVAKTAAKTGIGFYGSGLIIGGGFLAYHLLKNFITRNT